MSNESEAFSDDWKTKYGVKDGLDTSVERRARVVALTYRLIVEPDGRGGFVGTAEELPGGFARGASPEECLRRTISATTAAVGAMLTFGQEPPKPVVAAVQSA